MDQKLFFQQHPELERMLPQYREAFILLMCHAPTPLQPVTKRELSSRVKADPRSGIFDKRQTYSDYLRKFVRCGLIAEDPADRHVVWVTQLGEDFCHVTRKELLSLAGSIGIRDVAVTAESANSSPRVDGGSRHQ